LGQTTEGTGTFADHRLIGVGAFGPTATYKAELPALGLVAAVKVFTTPSGGNGGSDTAAAAEAVEVDRITRRAAFDCEVRALSVGQHPHLLQLVGVCTDGTVLFLPYQPSSRSNDDAPPLATDGTVFFPLY
jgi:hypothetical protein